MGEEMYKITYTVHPQYVSALFFWNERSFDGYFTKYNGSGNTVDKRRFK